MQRALMLASLLGVVACSGPDQDSNLQHASRAEPLIVLMGGNGSCQIDSQGRAESPYATGLYRRFVGLKERLRTERGINPSYIATCYGSSEEVRYTTSAAPDAILRSTVQNLGQIIRNEQHGGELFILGHSYGGWLAMKVGVALADAPIGAIFTVDPISRTDCNFSGNISGCTRAPRDISTNERQRISGAAGHWRNFFQTQTLFLHSSAIAEADVNSKIDAGHAKIDRHDETWAQIDDLFLADF